MKEFLDKYKFLECNYEEFKDLYENINNLHNHTLENLFLYFSLEDHMKKERIHFYPSMIFFNDRRRFKWFINASDFKIDNLFDFSLIPIEVKNKMSFYSDSELISDQLVKSKFKETVYDLDKVFDPQTYREKYKNEKLSVQRKKIYNRIEYPFKYLLRPELQFREVDITEEMLPEIEKLHKDWCEYKLNDPKTFKMMFSSNRYYRCLVQSFTSEFLNKSVWYRKAFYLGDTLIAVRQCLVKGDTSYDIGYFSRFWDAPSNIINYINTYCMKQLQNQGVKWHNCGCELNRDLKKFKEHFPCTERIGYKYNFQK